MLHKARHSRARNGAPSQVLHPISSDHNVVLNPHATKPTEAFNGLGHQETSLLGVGQRLVQQLQQITEVSKD